MRPHFSIFIGTSLDGFIARLDGSIDWLHQMNALVPPGEDCGYAAFVDSVDALLMGRHTYETVLGFGDWPYGNKPVYVLSNQLQAIAADLPSSVHLIQGDIESAVDQMSKQGHGRVYLDGGKLIQSFLAAGKVDELTVTRLPVLLGSGRPLFGPLLHDVPLTHVSTRVYPFGFIQSTYAVQMNE